MLVRVSYGPVISLNKWQDVGWAGVQSGMDRQDDHRHYLLLRNISGPVTIADYAGQSAKLGLVYYFEVPGPCQHQPAVLNLLPVPILMVGICCIMFSKSLGEKPLSDHAMGDRQQVGRHGVDTLMLMALLSTMMSIVDFRLKL